MRSSRRLATAVICEIMAPVPAGISEPTITFSFSPSRVSTLPLTDASVRTRVVSWNDAAEMNDRVCSEALVMPSSTGTPTAGFLPSASRRSLISSSARVPGCRCAPAQHRHARRGLLARGLEALVDLLELQAVELLAGEQFRVAAVGALGLLQRPPANHPH